MKKGRDTIQSGESKERTMSTFVKFKIGIFMFMTCLITTSSCMNWLELIFNPTLL